MNKLIRFSSTSQTSLLDHIYSITNDDNTSIGLLLYDSGAQTFWLVGNIGLSETLGGPQELIISIKIL